MLGGGADAFAVALIGGAGRFVFTSMIAAIGTGITALISWAVAAVLLVIAGLWWSRAIRRRTVEGRRLMDELEALRRGIESPGIAGFAPSEQLLPFAMALGVESRWADRIDREIRAAIGVQPGNPTPNYQPDWLHAGYLGTCIVASPLAICRTLHGALDHAVPTTSSSSSSSSGGGGGFDSGFSGSSGVGGGGGGGGGGGW
jgi:uncharacterized membrane protein YgcG